MDKSEIAAGCDQLDSKIPVNKMKYEKIYQKLKKKYSDEEIVDSMLIPADLTEKERNELAEEMKSIRMQKLRETTEEDRILSDVARLRFQMEGHVKKH